jgi:hypothetical protein
LTTYFAERSRDELAAEVEAGFAFQHPQQDLAREHVDAHRRHERQVVVVRGKRRAWWNAAADLLQPWRLGLLLERDDLPVALEPEDAHLRRRLRVDRLRRDRHVGFVCLVRVDELAVVHAIQMVAGKDQVVLRLVLREVPGRLTDRIRRALIPVRIVRRLLGRKDLDEPAGESIESIGIGDVAVERGRVELRQDVDAADVRMEAPADRDVDQSIFAADRDGRLRSRRGQRKQPGDPDHRQG